ncbi:S8 family serine peptidase [Aquabacterium sp.]|uniref:S8 family serine peptidase n=1 Tax=Aquabacterium sp. TaxID=1872578 RepID=UPI002C040B5F|nr:S8 family serine peptidase [Aquabacterium sp.]HSW04326.1 S8 family serine peptidase [Aquabacterium sp.]
MKRLLPLLRAACCAAALGAGVPRDAIAAAPTAQPSTEASAEAAMRADSSRYIVLAVDNPLRQVPSRAGSSLPAYGGTPRYVVGNQAATVLSAVAREHRLQEVAAWPIVALGLHCAVLALPEGRPRDAVLQALAQDRRVRLAQPLQDFALLGDAPGRDGAVAATTAASATTDSVASRYNDPYVSLQRGFAEIGALQAHRSSVGRDVPVAVVDTGLDSRHPDLQGRIAAQRDLVAAGAGVAPFDQDRHGTEVVGVIAAVANNGQGIVGIAPQARVSVYKACWYASAVRDAVARCNSFTLAKALAMVLESDARIVNLSLGGPADPLLDLLLQQLLRQNRIVIAALPPSGRREGFPAAMPGVIVVGSAGGTAPVAGVLMAPGRDVLTLVPGGRYDFASGSSIAAAHASGVAALLLAAGGPQDGAAMQTLLATATAPADKPASINAEAALAQLAQRARLAAR